MNLRLAAGLAALVLPLAGGVWAFAEFAARSEQGKADARLRGVIDRAIDRYQNPLEEAARQSRELAGSRRVQRALAQPDRPALRRLVRTNPNTMFAPAHGPAVGRLPGRSARRSIEVFVGTKPAGRVVVGVPLDGDLLRRLTRANVLPEGALTVLASGGRVVAPVPLRGRIELPTRELGSARFRGAHYRAASASLSGTRLVVLEPVAAIEGAASDLRRRILLSGLVVLLSVGLIGYAVAPGLSRGRFLRRQRAEAARVLSHLGEGVLYVDARGIVRLWNPAAERITGLAAYSVTGTPAQDAIPGWATIQETEAADARTISIRTDDRKLWLSISGAEFSEGTVYAFRDVTERQRLEEAKREFVATVSHELRTPLASLHGAALTLRERADALDEEARERLLAIITNQSTQLARLVEQILAAGQLESGRFQLAVSTFDAAELAGSVVEAAQHRLHENAAVELVGSSWLPPALGDEDAVRQVLSNLLDNALKYSPDGGVVTLELEPHQAGLRFTVRDQGVGIPVTERERIFEKFHRLDVDRVRGVAGSGLGLYICRELVDQMGGRIWVDSIPDVGSAFSFELPAAPPTPSRRRPPISRPARGRQ